MLPHRLHRYRSGSFFSSVLFLTAALLSGCPQGGISDADNRPAAELPDNTNIFVDVDRDHVFDEGTDIPIFNAIFADGSGTGGGASGVFDTAQAKPGYTPPTADTVDIVLAAKTSGRSSLKVPGTAASFSLRASGNIVMLASISSFTDGAITLYAETGYVKIGPSVSIDNAAHGISLIADLKVTMESRSSLIAEGPKGFVNIEAEAQDQQSVITAAELSSTSGVWISTGSLKIENTLIVADGIRADDAIPQPWLDSSWINLQTYRGLTVVGCHLESPQTFHGLDFQMADKPAMYLDVTYMEGVTPADDFTITLTNSELKGFARLELFADLPDPIIGIQELDEWSGAWVVDIGN